MKNIFVYGDSISMQYGFPLMNKLEQKNVNYNRLGGGNSTDLANPIYNGISTKEMLRWVNSVEKKENTILVFNCGLHDIVHIEIDDGCQVDMNNYRQNLISIIEMARTKFCGIIFCNTTPVDDKMWNDGVNKRFTYIRYNNDVIQYNQIAEEVMKNLNIPVVDLYTATLNRKKEDDVYIDGVHVNKQTSLMHAETIINELIKNGYIDG
jgi:lysophospholipase L1-like esterase